MEKITKLTILTLFAASSATSMACTYPGEPDFAFPNGTNATKTEMIETQGNVKAYVADVEGYLACLDEKQASGGDELTEEERAIYSLRYNAAVDSMEQVASKFNDTLRAYKDAQ